MPTVTIDGQAYEFDGKHRLLDFALEKGIEIPYFCYHPAMSVPTNCRMCLVEVGFHARDRASGEYQFEEDGKPKIMWGRKPATACNQPVGDKMYVKTHRSSETIKVAQQGVLEFMLINHPLDCPICDQAGECPLQIWTYKYGPEGSRFEVAKGHKKKHVELGPRVMMDQERCINCTRCTRFTKEVSKSSQLSIVGRGEKNYPSTAPGEVFDEAYSMNTIDICPVGALTSKSHRFKARVWEMNHAPAIDMNDATGTNTYVWIRDNKVLRITPRKNLEVNDYWMPDAHRLNVDYYNENRVSGISVKGGYPIQFGDGIKKAGESLKRMEGKWTLLGSAYESLESNFALKQLGEKLGVDTIYYISHTDKELADDWLISEDRTPNAAACEALGFQSLTVEELRTKLSSGEIEALYALENTFALGQVGSELTGKTVIAHATHQSPVYEGVDLLLPAALDIESDGTYINQKGLAQKSVLAKQYRQMAPTDWMRLPKSRLDKGAVAVDRWRNLDNIFDVLPSWQLLSMISEFAGLPLGYTHHKEVFQAVQPIVPATAELSFSYKPPKSAFKSTQLDFAPQWGAR